MSSVFAKDGHKIKMGQILVQIEINNEEKADSLDWAFLKNSFNQDGVILTKNFFLKERIDSLKKSLIEVKSGNYKSGLSVLSKKNVALLTLQSLVYLPLFVFFTKSTVVILAIVTVCGLVYIRSLPHFRPIISWIFLLLAGAISAAWSITPDQSLERAAKFSLFVVTLAGLMHVANRWSLEERQQICI